MGVVNKLGRAKSKEAVVRYMEIANKLKVNPRNIEHLTEIREYMKTIPKESAQISIVIREMRQFYDILEAFECPIADDDFKMFWSAVFWPRQVCSPSCCSTTVSVFGFCPVFGKSLQFFSAAFLSFSCVCPGILHALKFFIICVST